MLSAREISEKRFEKDKFGYRMDEVDAFLKSVAADYASLIHTAKDSEEKIIRLVEKINEYREDEDAIKMALITAQKEGAKIMNAAKTEAEKMIDEAKQQKEIITEQSASECEKIINEHRDRCALLIKENTEITEKKINDSHKKMEQAQEQYDQLRREISKFKSVLLEVFNKQMEHIQELPELSEEELTEMEAPKVAQVIPEQEAPAKTEKMTAEPEVETAAEEEQANAKVVDFYQDRSYVEKTQKFSDLKFGKNN